MSATFLSRLLSLPCVCDVRLSKHWPLQPSADLDRRCWKAVLEVAAPLHMDLPPCFFGTSEDDALDVAMVAVEQALARRRSGYEPTPTRMAEWEALTLSLAPPWRARTDVRPRTGGQPTRAEARALRALAIDKGWGLFQCWNAQPQPFEWEGDGVMPDGLAFLLSVPVPLRDSPKATIERLRHALDEARHPFEVVPIETPRVGQAG